MSVTLFLLLLPLQDVRPAQRQMMKVHVLVVKTRAEAEEMLKLLRQGIPFGRLVREHSIGPNKEQGGDMGYIDPEQVSPRVKQVLKGLKEGEHSLPLQTELGYTIFYHATDRYFEVGKTYFHEGKYPQAVEALERDLRLNPERTESLFLLGSIYESRGLWDQAFTFFERVLKIDPDFVLAYNALGVLYEHKGLWKEAEAMYQKAIALNPAYYEAHNNLANIYVRTGREQEAIAEYNKAINLNVEAAPVYDNLARLYGSMNLQLPEAINLAKRAILLAPEEASYHETLAQLYARAGEYGLAIQAIRKALQLAPHNEQYRQALQQIEALRAPQNPPAFTSTSLTDKLRTLYAKEGAVARQLEKENQIPSWSSRSSRSKKREDDSAPATLKKLTELEQELLALKARIEKLDYLEEELTQRKAVEKELYALLAKSEAERGVLEEKVAQLEANRPTSPISFSGANGTEESKSKEQEDYFFLAWSPDGKTYAVQRHTAMKDELWIHQFMLDQKRVLAEGQWGISSWADLPAPAVDFQWFADSDMYLFSIPIGETSILYLGKGKEPHQLALRVQGTGPRVTWAPHRHKFLYVQEGKLFLRDLSHDGAVRGPLTQSLHGITCPVWSPLGTDIAFSAKYEGRYDIYLYAPQDEKEAVIRRLTHMASQTPLCPSWSPGGTALAFYAPLSKQKGWGLFVLSSLTDLSPRLIAEKVLVPKEGPLWLDEHHLLYVGEYQRGGRGIFQLDLRTNRPLLLLQEQKNLSPLLRWSPVNQMIVYHLFTPQGMRIQFLPREMLQSKKR